VAEVFLFRVAPCGLGRRRERVSEVCLVRLGLRADRLCRPGSTVSARGQKKSSPSPSMHSRRVSRTRTCLNDQYLNREPVAFAVAIAEVFTSRKDWHQHDRAKRSFVSISSLWTPSCVIILTCGTARALLHCAIRFFTHPATRGVESLLSVRLPGAPSSPARQRAEQKNTIKRSGAKEKKLLNGKRSKPRKNTENTSLGERDAPPSPVGNPPSKNLPTHAMSCLQPGSSERTRRA